MRSNRPQEVMDGYYRLHSRIYDATRWTILFGRKGMLQALPLDRDQTCRVLEVGSGTGANIKLLKALYPQVEVTALDVSTYMMEKCRTKLRGLRGIDYRRTEFARSAFSEEERFDVILFPYSLSMFGEGFRQAIDDASDLLSEGGLVGVVDFHDSVSSMKWIWNAVHVTLDGHLMPYLDSKFETVMARTVPCYFGLWEYCSFIGRNAS